MELLDHYVHLSGLNKQDYLISRVLQREIIVNGNPRVYKSLRNEITDVTDELQHMGDRIEANEEFWLNLRMALEIVGGMREEAE